MKEAEDLKAFVQSIIHLHENKGFDELSGHILETEINEGAWISYSLEINL